MTRPKTGQGSKPDTGDQINSCGLLQTTHLIFPPGSEAKVFPMSMSCRVVSGLMIKLQMRKSACVLTSVDVSRHFCEKYSHFQTSTSSFLPYLCSLFLFLLLFYFYPASHRSSLQPTRPSRSCLSSPDSRQRSASPAQPSPAVTFLPVPSD